MEAMERELTGQIVHSLPDLPVIDIVAVEEIHISLIELLVGLLGAAVGCSGALSADDGSPRYHRGTRRRGHACRYDAQHFFPLKILAREMSVRAAGLSVCCVNQPRKSAVQFP